MIFLFLFISDCLKSMSTLHFNFRDTVKRYAMGSTDLYTIFGIKI